MDKEMKEVNRQIKMGWERGFYLGLWFGACGMLVFGSLIKLLW